LGITNATLQNIVPSIQPSQITGGVRGDIAVFETGATVVGGVRSDTSEVAGCIGANTFGDSQGLVANMCRTRPWASNFLSRIISPSFFDGLCSWRGYTVGEPAPQITAPVVTVQQQPVHEVQVSQTTTAPGVEPKVR